MNRWCDRQWIIFGLWITVIMTAAILGPESIIKKKDNEYFFKTADRHKCNLYSCGFRGCRLSRYALGDWPRCFKQ